MNIVKKIIRRGLYGVRSSSEEYIKYLRKCGLKIGDHCTIFSPTNTVIDIQYPWMIDIGNNVQIAHGVIMLTHDYSWSVLKHVAHSNFIREKGAILGASGKIIIGNNVFIGMNAIIMRNVRIGDNVVIGAGSIVNKDLQSNGVYAGNPCKYIMSIEEYYVKRESAQVEEAMELAKEYYKRYGKLPDESVFHEYFMLFHDDLNNLKDVFKQKLSLTGNFEQSSYFLKLHKKKFENYEAFLIACNLIK